jgi:tetratricopeptide (TPR) repeat protein
MRALAAQHNERARKVSDGDPAADLLGQAIEHAVACQGQGMLAEAATLCEHVLGVRPAHFDALQLLGVLRQQQGRSEEAFRLLSTALRIVPDSADALSNLGVALKNLDRWQEALDSYARALELKPDHVGALINRSHACLNLHRFEEALASCDAALAIDPDHPVALNNRGNTLIELKRPAEALIDFRRALGVNPTDPNLMTSVGRALQELGRIEEVLDQYAQALALQPDQAQALTNRGYALSCLGRLDEALASLDRAVEAKPDFPEALSNRGNVLRALNRHDAAIVDYLMALAIRPDSVVALNNLGVTLNGLNRCEGALARFDAALAIQPDHAEVHFNRSLLLMTMGELGAGGREYEWRWRQEDWADRRRNFLQPLWLGEAQLAGKTILLHAEQGLGDTLHFVRYVPMVARRGARVILEVQPSLKSLLGIVEGIAAIVGNGEPLPPFDLHCPLMSLPLAFGTELETIPADMPYLLPSADLLAKWEALLGDRCALRVGIAWAGSPAHKNNRSRSIAPERLERLLSMPGVEFISLQKDLSEPDRATLARAEVRTVGEMLEDFADTAAVISLLDLVISVDTAVAHLAGALGKPTWVMLPYSPDFRWLLERRDSPWYPTARLFRQPQIGDWESVIEEVGAELAKMERKMREAVRRSKPKRATPPIASAIVLHRQGRLDEAERLYRAILDASPAHFDALHLYGVLKHQQGHSAEALRLVAAALKADPKSAPALSNHGVILDALKRHEEALASLEQALALNAGDITALYNRGNALKALGRLDVALASYDDVLSRQPNHVDALIKRGRVLAALARHEDALASLDEALALQPRRSDALTQRGNVLGVLKRHDDALAAYEAALAIGQDHAEAFNNRSVVLCELKRPAEALASCERALVARPDYVDAHYNRGNALVALGRHREAMESYDRALTLDPNRLDVLNNRGLALAACRRDEEALASWLKLLAIEPRHVEALLNRARFLMELQRYEEALAAFDGIIDIDPERVDALSDRGLLLAKLGRHEDALRAYDEALAVKPDCADVMVNCGNSLIELKRFDDALTVFHRALTIDPKHFVAHTNRGNALFRLKRFPEALDSYEKAVEIAPEQVQGLNNRGIALAALGRHDEAFKSYNRAIELDPNFVEAYVNRGNLFGAVGCVERALADYTAALGINPDRVEARWNASLAQLTLGRFRAGWKEYEWRWRKEETAGHRRNFSQPLWLGEEEVAGRSILLHAEQGMGDTLQFVRYAPLLARRGAKVILEVQAPLQPLLSAVEGVADTLALGSALPSFDLHCPFMSLPLAFGTELGTIPSDIPYVAAPADRRSKWQARLGAQRALRVGVAWAGSPIHINDRNRSIPLRRFSALFAAPDVEFVSLQKELPPGDAATLARHGNVISLGGELEDFADTAALVSLLDLVVSVDTSVVHLAGALGAPFWVLVPFAPDFRWLIDRDDSPWYPTGRLFRQAAIDDWAGVLERVRTELEKITANPMKQHRNGFK